MTDYEDLQKRCQRGATNLNDANNLLADCYGMLGKLWAENEALRNSLTDWKRAAVERETMLVDIEQQHLQAFKIALPGMSDGELKSQVQAAVNAIEQRTSKEV